MTPLGSRPAQAARFSATLLLTGAGLSTLWWASSAGKAGAWPLLIVSPFFAVAIYSDRSLLRRTPLDMPLLIFLAAAIAGFWAAYDSNAAQNKFWMLVAAGILFYALALQPVSNLPLVVSLFAALGLVTALVFLLTYHWQPSNRPILAIPAPPPNITEGLIAFLAPFQLAIAHRVSRDRRGLPLIAVGIAFLFTLLALILTSARGAMVALIAGLAAWFTWRQLFKHRAVLLRHSRALLALLATTLVAGALAIASGWIWPLARVLDRLLGSAGDMSRTQLAAHTLDLITDFPLTGAGLATFPGLYSRYILGIPYYFLPNGHNIVLDITLEQGLTGAFAFLLIVIVTFWLLLRRTPHVAEGASNQFLVVLAGAAIASFLALLIHGLVEDTVYGSAALPLLFTVPGLATALNNSGSHSHKSAIRAWDRRIAVAAGIAVLVLLGASALPQGRALWSSNLGAIRMARIDLAGFPTDQWVHIDDGDELRDAEEHFQNALRHNPQQRTALHRLGLLSLQRGDFVTASHYLQRASVIDPGHIGVRKALGYSYAWSGDVQQALQNLQAAPFVAQELEAYVAWWQQQGRRDLAQTAGQMKPYFFNTENEQ